MLFLVIPVCSLKFVYAGSLPCNILKQIKDSEPVLNFSSLKMAFRNLLIVSMITGFKKMHWIWLRWTMLSAKKFKQFVLFCFVWLQIIIAAKHGFNTWRNNPRWFYSFCTDTELTHMTSKPFAKEEQYVKRRNVTKIFHNSKDIKTHNL